MIRKTLLILALCAGFNSAAAGPFLARASAPTAAELGLNPQQTSAWQAIQADAQALRGRTLQSVESELAQAKNALGQENADLRAISLQFQMLALSVLAEQKPIRERRLAFYNSLNASQQQQVRGFLIEQINRAERAIRAYEVLQGE